MQHIVGDWKNSSDKKGNGHDDYWEAWHIGRGKSETDYHKKFGFDDRFSGGLGTKIHAEARFYEGLKLPASFKPFSVYHAHDLPATHKDPNLPTNRATSPLVRDWP